MRLTFSTLACPTWSLPQIVGAAAAHGLDGFDPRGVGAEIDITRLPRFDSELDQTLALLRQYNLQMPCLNTSIALVTPAGERWQMMLEECQRYAALASVARSPFLRVFGGALPRAMKRDEGLALAGRHLSQLVRICSNHRCIPLVETHDDWSTSAEIMQLLSAFSPDDVGAIWDVEHPWRKEERPADTIAGLGRYLRHVHLKDLRHVDGRPVPVLLGQGELPLQEMLDALRASGYDGWICLETERRWHPEHAPEPEESLPQFVRYMRRHWLGEGHAPLRLNAGPS